jgi:adenine-specific DNA-methyltransferase
MNLDILENQRLAQQTECDRTKQQSERNRLGQFATPTKLAREMLAYGLGLLESKSAVRFLDPALGTGAFFSALLRTIKSRCLSRAVGFEIDSLYADGAKKLWRGKGLEVRIEDFTKVKSPESETDKFNFVICNPPYVRHHHLGPDDKSRLRATVQAACGAHINGLAGLYCYFLGLAHPWMNTGAIAGWLLPSEFMDVNYGVPVKDYLLSRVTLLRIHRFDPNEVQFGDALVSSAIVWFRNRIPNDNHSVELSFGGSFERPTRTRLISVRQLRIESKWTRLTNGHTINKIDSVPLGCLFSIKRGIATGANDLFIVTPAKIEQHRLPMKFLVPILPSPRHLSCTEVFADEEGDPVLEFPRFLLDCRLGKEELKAKFPALWSYLEEGRRSGVANRYLCEKRSPWYSQETRRPTPFLCTYIGRSDTKSGRPFRFILNHSRAIAANVYLMLYPKPPLEEALRQDRGLARSVWQSLNEIDPTTMTSEGRVYGGGLHKLEPKELANVPVDQIGPMMRAYGRSPNHEQLLLCDR